MRAETAPEEERFEVSVTEEKVEEACKVNAELEQLGRRGIGEQGTKDAQKAAQALAAGSSLKVDGQYSDGASRVWVCARGVLFVKRNEDPTTTRILRIDRQLGSLVYSTGRIWTGPNGGKWAEADVGKGANGDFGWLLINGPGFGLDGPALEDASRHNMIKVEVMHLGQPQGIIWRGMMRKEETVAAVKAKLAYETGLTKHHCCLAKDHPSTIPGTSLRLGADYMPELRDEKTLESCNFKDMARLFLVYVGDMPPDLKAAWAPIPQPPENRA